MRAPHIMCLVVGCFCKRGTGRIRTFDLRGFNPLLFRLSYSTLVAGPRIALGTRRHERHVILFHHPAKSVSTISPLGLSTRAACDGSWRTGHRTSGSHPGSLHARSRSTCLIRSPVSCSGLGGGSQGTPDQVRYSEHNDRAPLRSARTGLAGNASSCADDLRG